MKPDRKPSEAKVVALPERRRDATGRAGPDADAARPGGRSLSRWLGAALVLAAALLVAQVQRAGRLTERVAVLTTELDAARSAVESYRSRMKTVRAHVSGLSAQLDELERLVAPDPEETGR